MVTFELIITALLSLFAGVIICRIFNYLEIHNLKEQLFEAEKDNEIIVKDNADLSRQNDVLRRRIWELERKQNIPKFGD